MVFPAIFFFGRWPRDGPDICKAPGCWVERGMLRASVLLLLTSARLSACAAAPASQPAAAEGFQLYIDALNDDDARTAYELLSAELRADMTFQQFAALWKASEQERRAQVRSLESTVEAAPTLGERAHIRYPDGKTVHLTRDPDGWRLEHELVSRTRATRPHDAVEIFSAALEERNYDRIMRILTERRRRGIASQVEAFTAGLRQHLTEGQEEIYLVGRDRAELKWINKGVQYKIVLRRESDEWRVDDLHVGPHNEAAADDSATEERTSTH